MCSMLVAYASQVGLLLFDSNSRGTGPEDSWGLVALLEEHDPYPANAVHARDVSRFSSVKWDFLFSQDTGRTKEVHSQHTAWMLIASDGQLDWATRWTS